MNQRECKHMNSELIQKKREYFKAFRAECAKKQAVGSRKRIAGVDVIVHEPEIKRENMPVIFMMHGGAWVGCDAVMIDSLLKTLADTAGVYAVNVNYTKLDEKPYPNPLEEILAVAEHFRENCGEYGVSPDKFVLAGCSAGAHLAACAAILAKDRGIKIARQILVYPYLDWTGETENSLQKRGIAGIDYADIVKMFFGDKDLKDKYISPLAADDRELTGVAPADIIACGTDALRPHAVSYYEKLLGIGVPATIREYEKAIHGFIEVNRPDFWEKNGAQSEEQAGYARDLERYMAKILENM